MKHKHVSSFFAVYFSRNRRLCARFFEPLNMTAYYTTTCNFGVQKFIEAYWAKDMKIVLSKCNNFILRRIFYHSNFLIAFCVTTCAGRVKPTKSN